MSVLISNTTHWHTHTPILMCMPLFALILFISVICTQTHEHANKSTCYNLITHVFICLSHSEMQNPKTSIHLYLSTCLSFWLSKIMFYIHIQIYTQPTYLCYNLIEHLYLCLTWSEMLTVLTHGLVFLLVSVTCCFMYIHMY